MKGYRKLIIRADDMGYTDVCNIGAFKTIEEGVVTSADVMLDSPGTVDALKRLRKMPWISIGWHDHFWGAPVLDPAEVPSLYDAGRNGFRRDIVTTSDISFEEALKECRAEILRCREIAGRVPDTGGLGGMKDSPISKAMKQVCDEFGIPHDFIPVPECFRYLAGDKETDSRWKDFKLFSPFEAFADLQSDSIEDLMKYDPVSFYTEDKGHMLEVPEDTCIMNCWHPGYIDYHVLKLGDHGPNAHKFLLARAEDVHALCSKEVREWIRKNRFELVGMRDALLGTDYYQEHLREIGSDLAVRPET